MSEAPTDFTQFVDEILDLEKSCRIKNSTFMEYGTHSFNSQEDFFSDLQDKLSRYKDLVNDLWTKLQLARGIVDGANILPLKTDQIIDFSEIRKDFEDFLETQQDLTNLKINHEILQKTNQEIIAEKLELAGKTNDLEIRFSNLQGVAEIVGDRMLKIISDNFHVDLDVKGDSKFQTLQKFLTVFEENGGNSTLKVHPLKVQELVRSSEDWKNLTEENASLEAEIMSKNQVRISKFKICQKI